MLQRFLLSQLLCHRTTSCLIRVFMNKHANHLLLVFTFPKKLSPQQIPVSVDLEDSIIVLCAGCRSPTHGHLILDQSQLCHINMLCASRLFWKRPQLLADTSFAGFAFCKCVHAASPCWMDCKKVWCVAHLPVWLERTWGKDREMKLP